ncbi:MAG: hypothetical protein NXI04_29385 [Planctomycetaceae bacterium]|nr:hypothetical protein [Planctomycetaceae bacterium]
MTQSNPFQPPAAQSAGSRRRMSDLPWWGWLLISSGCATLLTGVMIYLDSLTLISDSGPLVMILSGVFWLILSVVIGRMYLWKKALLLATACGGSIWLSIGGTAAVLVPLLLNGAVGPTLFSFLLKVFGYGCLAVPAVTFISGLVRKVSPHDAALS